MCWNEWKTSINFINPDLWPPTASWLQCLTVIMQCVYQMMCRNVYEFKKWLVKSVIVWSRALSILLSINGENISMPVFTQCTHISSNFAVGSWKRNTWLKCQSKYQESCASFRLSNSTVLGKKAIFCWFCFLKVVHKQTLGEVGN